MSNKNTGTPWFTRGDVNGFFGLFSNVLANFLTAVGLLFVIGMPGSIVSDHIIPGTAIALGFGGIIFAIQTRKKSLETGNKEMTALPYGLSVPHYFMVAFAVILPVYLTTNDWGLAWATAVAWNFVQGIIMVIGAIVGPYIQKHVPRPALLGSLAGIAVTFIAMNPFGAVFSTPYIGMITFAIVIAGWIASKKLPGNIPAGLFAIIVGMILAWATGYMDLNELQAAASDFSVAVPSLAIGRLMEGFAYLSPFLAAAIPLAIYNFLESLDNVESAEVEGDVYPTTLTMLVPGVLTLVGAIFGSPFPTIIYIGHVGWKKAGARVGYSMATGVAVLVLAFIGLLPLVMSAIPLVALLPILIYIAMSMGKQAFTVTPARHVPALIFGLMPFIASFTVLQINNALGAAGTSASEVGYDMLQMNGVFYEGWSRAGASDILVSMMLISIVIFIIDKKFLTAAVYTVIAGLLAFFGFMHAPEIGWASGLDVGIGYGVMAIGLLFFHFYKTEENVLEE